MTATVLKSKALVSSSFVFSEEAQREARAQLHLTSLPDKNEEPWRKIDLRALAMPAFLESAEAALKNTDSLAGIEIEAPKDIASDASATIEACLWNGSTLQKRPLPNASGFLLSDISLNELSAIEARFEKSGRSYDYFDTCNRAFASHVLYIKIKGRPAGPLRIRHRLSFGQSLIHRIYVVAEELCEATIIEEFLEEGGAEKARLYLPSTLLLCKPGSQVEHITKTSLPKNSWHFLRTRYLQEKDSSLRSAWIHLGAKSGKDLIVADLQAAGTSFRGLGIKLADEKEFSDVDVAVCHHASHSQSSLLYKMVLSGGAHSVFTGNLFIEPGTKDIDSHQENHNILLSETARAESMPDLVIQAEEVSCEHGATVGALDSQALFFLMARGLREDEARELLIEAFLASLLEELSFGSLSSEASNTSSASQDSAQTSGETKERWELIEEFRKKLSFGKAP